MYAPGSRLNRFGTFHLYRLYTSCSASTGPPRAIHRFLAQMARFDPTRRITLSYRVASFIVQDENLVGGNASPCFAANDGIDDTDA